ncbi:Fe-S protein assembly co-chaperone HscB [Neisseria weaveri]|uniref:Co-chaperone protein HscB homolog n=1 Tax=Neisseria weaveri TaxID=28091 RepID=A0A448VQI1_9NEIS|nr:Fe-S protein assembly co-chaperone HscB [Neisseria weaveri]EGV34714.1 Fe-S protein assembly co-chaperone HscB [Neisseria weaveri ATCC 51223]EGV35784.1 Fe-S protein assembly co-chaperone HscB [Neisseria weaveri LMG 5135]SAY50644.1 chaperone protein HscB [Neisseria weaveri]VEJ52056.1 chaperone protein HscB [Neisseria weaveri]
MSQFFQLFSLPEQFPLDNDALEQRYRTAAAQCHPDKFAAASSFEQKQAMMMASLVNEAYQTLKSPLERAAYLLKQQQIDADAPEHTSFAPDFLMQQMEWREALEDARAENNQTALANLDNDISGEQNTLYGQLQTAFEQAQYEQAAELVRKGRFLNKLRQEIRQARS